MAVEEDDEGAVDDVANEVERLREILEKLEFRRMFSGEMDPNNAYLDIQAGSGGTEAQDWANMLLRMYLRWADKHGFDATIIELSEGEVAGIKGATVHIKGEYAFGWLRTEIGVHRLVRKSPFDSGNRRHTSFTAVFVSPEIDDNIEIEINPADLRIDTYRSSGAGGQHVNTTDSAVRITHVPTNTVVACQNERSQHANKDTAMKMLRAKLYELEMQKRTAASQALEDSKSDIGWEPPDPLLRARPVADQGPAYRYRAQRLRQGARRRSRRIPRSQPQTGAVKLLRLARPRWKMVRTARFFMIVNSVSSPFPALPGRRSLRFSPLLRNPFPQAREPNQEPPRP